MNRWAIIIRRLRRLLQQSRLVDSLPVEGLIGMRHQTFRIRRAESGDEALLRQIRLEALSEAPEAFGSTLDRERARTPVDWQKWLSTSATFLLETDNGPKGIAAGVPDSTDKWP